MLDPSSSAFLSSIMTTGSEAMLKDAIVQAARSGDAEVTAMIALGYLARRKGVRPTADLVLLALTAADAVLREPANGPKQ